MTHLDNAFEARRHALDLDFDLVIHALKNSNGRPTMSDEDIKLSIVALNGIVIHQQELIRNLFAEFSMMQKSPWYKRIFGK